MELKEIKVSTELRKMSEIQVVSDQTISNLIHQKFEKPLAKKPDDDDPFIKGEFDVIKELLANVSPVLTFSDLQYIPSVTFSSQNLL